MPEIGEVARIVHFIRQHLVGKTLATVKAQHDENVFGKVGTSAAEFEKNMKGKKIVDAGQQGKYFWMTMETPPHPVLHFGMAGWFHIRGQSTYYYKSKTEEEPEWPPKYWKFLLETKAEAGSAKVEAAYVDFRRFGRVRLLDCPGEDIRSYSPLKENGPDPVIDKDLVTVEWLTDKCRSKRIPIKALLLDQANISGIGNWVGDELLYHAKIHPEQYSNSLSDDQLKKLHKSLHYVCGLSCELLAESDKFPSDWLFKHRWGKGKKDSSNKLPNGEKIVFITVGGRTSAVVPSVQKKTGPVAGNIKAEEVSEEENDSGKKANTKRKRTVKKEEVEDDKEEVQEKGATSKRNETVTKKSKTEADSKDSTPLQGKKKSAKTQDTSEGGGRRRSTRLRQG